MPFRGPGGGFSLVEILVVVALLSVIVLGLLAMFTQTQRAFRTGMTQSDVLEGGRLTMDLMTRELDEAAPAYQAGVNFYAWLPNTTPFYQDLPGTAGRRTNLLQDLFFVLRENQKLIGIGYLVRSHNPAGGQVGIPTVMTSPIMGAGTLYRFETSAAPLSGRGVADLFAEFSNVAYTNYWPPNALPVSRIMDGVIHLKVRAYDTNGAWIVEDADVSASGAQENSNIRLSTTVAPGEVEEYRFFSNALPAAVELELGILEDRVWQQYKAQPTATAQSNFLFGVAGRVHVFRQRIPIRNVDPVAYQ